MKLFAVIAAVAAAVFLFGSSSSAGDGSFAVHVRDGGIKIDARITPLPTVNGVAMFEVDVTRIDGVESGSIGLSTGRDGSCYCAILGAAHFSVDGKTRNVLAFEQAWLAPDGAPPCGLIVTNASDQIVAAGALRTVTCR